MNWTLKTKTWAGRVARVVERLPSKCETLSSKPGTEIKKKRKNYKTFQRETLKKNGVVK
jgi:hypothetical protein